MTTKAELEGLRAHAVALQNEWRSIRAAAPDARLEKEREVEAEALREEIARMQGVLTQEVKNSGGTVEDALAAMQRAAELERQVTEQHTTKREVANDDEAYTDPPPNAHTSSSIAAAPAVPVPGHQASPPQSDEDDEDTDGDENEEEVSR